MAGKMLNTFNILARAAMLGCSETFVDTGGTNRTVESATTSNSNYVSDLPGGYAIEMNSPAAEGIVTNGVVCGSSTTPVLLEDIVLGALIPNGDINGTLHYMNMTVGARVVNGDGSSSQEFTRIVTNNGTINVTINEVAYYARVRIRSNHYNVCVYREVLATPIVVIPAQSATIRCTVNIPCLVA